MSLLLTGGGSGGGGGGGGGGGDPIAEIVDGDILVTGSTTEDNYFSLISEGADLKITRTGGLTAGAGFTQDGEDSVKCNMALYTDGVFNGGSGDDTFDLDLINGDPATGGTFTCNGTRAGTTDTFIVRTGGPPLFTASNVDGTFGTLDYNLAMS